MPACAAAGQATTTLPTGVNWNQYGSYDVGPLLPRGALTHVFLDAAFWSRAEASSMATSALPDVLVGTTFVVPQRSASGYSSVLFQKAGGWFATAYDGVSFEAPVALMPISSTLEGRVAGDGHHWIRHGGTFFEQTPTGFVSRGGGPSGGTWDVLADGTVVIVALPSSAPNEVVVWRLLPGATAWTQQTALGVDAVATFAAAIENGFEPSTATIAPDGSVHVFTAARCIGQGERNRAQAYARFDPQNDEWHVELLPAAEALTDGLRTWNQAALWAGDREHVRFVYTSSTQPTYDGWSYVYPERKYDVVSRCRLADGTLSFGRVGRVRHPEWTQRGFATFSETGVATLLTKSLGLTQVW